MPTIRQPIANTPRCCVHAHSAIAPAPHTAATTIAHRSPRRIVISDAGRLLTSEPMPISATASAAVETDAPISRAESGTMGRMAPSPTPNSSEGPKAGTAIRRSEKDFEGIGFWP